MVKSQNLEHERIEKLVRAEVLGLDASVISRNLPNSLLPQTQDDIEDPCKHFLRIIRDPANFAFTAKHVFNINLAPFQLVIFDELWRRKYPMLIASRGGSKSFMLALYALAKALIQQGSKIIIVGSAFRQAKVIFEYCEQIWHRAPVLRDIVGTGRRSGPRRNVDRCTFIMGDSSIIALPLGDGSKIRGQRANVIIADEFACLSYNTIVETSDGMQRIGECSSGATLLNRCGEYETSTAYIKTPLTDVYEVTTENGYSFKCSNIHKVMTSTGWKLGKDLTNSDYLVFDNKYQWPNNNVVVDGQELTRDIAWLMGLLVSEGGLTAENYISIKTTDEDLVARVKNKFPDCLIYDKEAYIDRRGWNCKKSYDIRYNNTKFRQWLLALGLDYVTYYDKKIPWSILQSPKDIMISFLSGLFEGDGSCFLWDDKGRNNKLGVAYYSVSETLINDLQVILSKLNISCYKSSRDSKLSNNLQYFIRCNGEDALSLVDMLRIVSWKQIAATAYTYHHSDTYGITYCKDKAKWKACIKYNGKQTHIGYAFTKEAALLLVKQFLYTHPKCLRVRSVRLLPNKEHLYDFYLPLTNSFYGNGFVQHNSIPKAIYEEVVSGFASVNASPIESMERAARIRVLKELGIWTEEMAEREAAANFGNQAIIAGTANYGFNHFAEYWNQHKAIIHSRGNPKKLLEALQGKKIPAKFNWRNYSIIRLPVELLPEGFMDEEHVARAQLTTSSTSYQIEYGAVFAVDSNGFYKRSIIESCVVKDENMQNMLPSVEKFFVTLRGQVDKRYIISIDPASESDNCSITILELYPNHRRTVYGWTTNREKHIQQIKHGSVKEKNYYAYCARKIRNLMKDFHCVRIIMDSQGGGRQIAEALHDNDKLEQGEVPIWEIVDDNKPKWSDSQAGEHILELVEFSRAEWVSEANHGLKKDMEDKVLLFPYLNPIKLFDAAREDKKLGRIIINKKGEEIQLADTLEDAAMEIEALKEELTTIQHTQTPGTNRDHWDTPAIKQAGGRAGRLRKDRYSALLMANMAARQMQRAPAPIQYHGTGGLAKTMVNEQPENHSGMASWFSGTPDWFVHPEGSPSELYEGGMVVRRGGVD